MPARPLCWQAGIELYVKDAVLVKPQKTWEMSRIGPKKTPLYARSQSDIAWDCRLETRSTHDPNAGEKNVGLLNHCKVSKGSWQSVLVHPYNTLVVSTPMRHFHHIKTSFPRPKTRYNTRPSRYTKQVRTSQTDRHALPPSRSLHGPNAPLTTSLPILRFCPVSRQ